MMMGLRKIEDVQLLLGSASKPTSKPTIHSYKKNIIYLSIDLEEEYILKEKSF